MADVGMDQVLEAVADAVAQLVLFSVEAEENNSMLPNIVPGAEAVQRAVNVLVDIASEMAGKFGSEKHIQDKMYEAATSVRGATQQIVDAARALSGNQFDQNAKKILLSAAKDILQGTVKELHLADKYEVIKIVKAATQCKEHVSRSSDVTSNEMIMDVARSLSAAVVALVKLVNARLTILVDPMLKRRLETANNTMKNDTQSLVKAMGTALQNPFDASARAAQRSVADELQAALDEIILVAKLSCKTMFDSLDLDFGTDFKRPTLAELRECHERICRECDQLSACVYKSSADDTANALFALNGSISQEVKIAGAIAQDCDEVQRLDIFEACDGVERMPALVIPAVKAAHLRTSPASSKDHVKHLADQTKQASAEVLAACVIASSAADKLREMMSDLDRYLRELEDGVRDCDKAKAARAAKAVADTSAEASSLARAMADVSTDPLQSELIMEEVARMENQTPRVVAATKAAMADPSNRALAERVRAEAGGLQDAGHRLVDAATIDPAELLRRRTEQLEDELRRLEDAVRRGDLKDAAEHLKAAKDLIGENLRLAERLARDCDDPVRQQKLEAAIARLRDLDSQLVPLAKAALGGDRAAIAGLAQLLAELGRVSDELESAAQPSLEDQLKRNMDEVDEALNRLQDALDRGDLRGARQAVKDVNRGLDNDGRLIERMLASETDPTIRRNLEASLRDIQRLQPDFAQAAERAIANPSDHGARQALDRVAGDVRDTHSDLNRHLPTPDERIANLARSVGDNLARLENSASRGDRPGATDAAKSVVGDVSSLIGFTDPIGRTATDPLQRERIVAETNALRQLAPQLVAATKSALENPRDKSKQNNLADASDRLHSATDALARAALLPPDQNIAENAAKVNSRLNDIRDSAARGDQPNTHVADRKLQVEVPKHIEVARAYAQNKQHEDPAYARSVQTNADELSRLLPQIHESAARAAQNPRDKRAQDELGEYIERAKNANSRLVPNSSAPEELFPAAAAAVDHELGRLIPAVNKGDRGEADAAVRAVREAAEHQNDLAHRMAAAPDFDPRRRADLDAALAELDRLMRQIPNAVSAGFASKANVPQLERLIHDTAAANARISELAMRPTREQLLTNAQRVHRALDEVDRNLGNKDQLAPALGEAQRALEKQQRLVKTLSNQEPDPDRKARLQRALGALEGVHAHLPDASRNAAANPRNPQAQGAAKDQVKRGHDATDLSVAAATPDSKTQLLNAVGSLHSGLAAIPPAIVSGSAADKDAGVNALDQAIADLNRAAGAFARERPEIARPLITVTQQVKPANDQVKQSTQAAFNAPRDKSKQDNLGDSSNALRKAASNVIGTALGNDLPNNILDNSILTDDALDRLAAAVRRGNRQDAVDALKDAKDALGRQAALARALAATTKDPAQRKALEAAADEIEKALRELEDATFNALAKPHDKDAQQRFNQAVQAAKVANASAVVEAHPGGAERALAGGKRLGDGIKAVTNAVKAGDKAGALKKLDEVEQDLKRQGALCKALAIKTTDNNKRRQLLEAAMALQNSLATLLGPIRDAITKGDDSALDLLNKLLSDTNKSNSALEALKQPEEDEGEPQDEIMREAYRVESVVKAKLAARLDEIDESTPEGRIYGASRRLAKEMALMSEAASRNSNADVINSARRITALVQSLFKDAQNIASLCKDPRLRDQVLAVAHSIPNIAVQLKVITSVKAATPNDTTVKAQLVTCARNLASSVVSLCNATEIASIRFN
eukprot:TRINITY_DN1459_c0_g1_i1.p1 TRINITY_DN1459_c0_g1~~TRINITY_DN1459_c0_g1_i1.p1  ORF type:complete len:1738 (+),score=380.38 TRINITY_DN1459_c0_g1_i1:131-5344(+)